MLANDGCIYLLSMVTNINNHSSLKQLSQEANNVTNLLLITAIIRKCVKTQALLVISNKYLFYYNLYHTFIVQI